MPSESDAPTDRATGPGSRGPYPKGVRRRQEILDRTIEVFADVGFEGASLRAVGEAIGVSHAALRRYFDTREELFLEVLREKDRQAMAEARGRDHDDHDDGSDVLGLARSLDAYASQVPGLMALRHSMVARALEAGNEHSRAFFLERYAALRGEVLSTLTLARAAGVVRDDLPLEAAATLVIATLDGLSTQWLLDPGLDIRPSMVLLEQLLTPPQPHVG
ncbi:TetR/AcrR family transcriptional regulator [Microlunatus antarcticus]|uniref:AcrR family transcriptional regulator n=1 Tax=Microlunatus antarcticus TaxID=53388 RepID=A0A7W5JVU5_9ACTN|nr:TetR/AcrR family transcriptional regulator [Microlunatus antarcticus]MBB3327209.1 AcrR family transcriptional regulator [Microlunatus antarcticus]